MKTKFSIIMPVYNSKDTLAKAIESILKQSYQNYELIIVDDNSSDGSYNIAKKFSYKDKRIRLYRLKENKGVAFCRNFGTKKAKFDWIGQTDSDIIATKDWLFLAEQHTYESNKIFGGKVIYLKINKKYFNMVFYYLEKSLFPKKKIVYNKFNLKEPNIGSANLFFNKSVLNVVNGFDTTVKMGTDRLFLSTAVEKGLEVIYNPELFVYHPLYDYKNIKNFLRRAIFSTRWKNVIIRKSKLMEKPYKKVPYFLLFLLIGFLLIYLIFGFINIITPIGITLISIIMLYSLKLFFKNKVPLKYIPGYILINFIKKSVTACIYLLKLKPQGSDWKKR